MKKRKQFDLFETGLRAVPDEAVFVEFFFTNLLDFRICDLAESSPNFAIFFSMNTSLRILGTCSCLKIWTSNLM